MYNLNKQFDLCVDILYGCSFFCIHLYSQMFVFMFYLQSASLPLFICLSIFHLRIVLGTRKSNSLYVYTYLGGKKVIRQSNNNKLHPPFLWVIFVLIPSNMEPIHHLAAVNTHFVNHEFAVEKKS